MLTASGLAKAYGSRVLFDNVAVTLAPGRRIALVGGNGVGKTTLLEILAGWGDADRGEVHRPKELRLGYLPQELADIGEGPVIDVVLAGAGEVAKVRALLEQVDVTTDVEAYGELQSRFEQLGGYALEGEAHRILSGLGFSTSDTARPLAELSGGWRMRVALARMLLAAPDVLLLDEPTNHLDVDSVAWLEQQLAAWTGALLFVSHDRDFIDAVADRVIELSGGTAAEYVGGFAEFVAEREERIARLEAAAANQARKVAQTERFIERFRYKATKARQVQSRVKALKRLDKIELPTRRELAARFAFPEPPRSARVVVELEDATVGYDGTPVLSDVGFAIERGRKVALVGPNGAGKTTLVRLLLGELRPTEGTVKLGANVDTAVFVQDQAETLDPKRTAYEELKLGVGHLTGSRNLRTILGSFGFSGEAADRLIGDLSGGERTRLALAKVMAVPVNLLVLDEPTNHLDLPSCDTLEDALIAYPGTVVLVTHDRHLIRSVADALVEVRGGKARWHEGVDERTLAPPPPEPKRSPAKAKTKAKPKAKAKPKPKAKPKAPSKRKLDEVEQQWEAAEAEVAELQRRLADPDLYTDPETVQEVVARHEAAKDRAAELMVRWESLAG